MLAGRYAVQPNITERVQLLSAEARTLNAPAGSLLIDTAQPYGRVAVMLLDPRSTSSLFRYPAYAALVDPGREHFVYAVFEGVARAR